MLCRLRHTGRVNTNLSVSDFTLAPGFTSPDFDLVKSSPDEMVVQEWVNEGLIEILPPNSAGKTETVGRLGDRSKGHTMTAEEVKEYMSPDNKRRRRSTALTRTERNVASHRPPIGMPFGPKKGTRILTAEDLANGKPEALPPPPPPHENALEDRTKKGKIYTSEEVPVIREAKGKELTPGDLKKMNKANIEIAAEEAVEEIITEEIIEEAAAITEEAEETTDKTEEELAEEEMGEQPVDNVITDAIDAFVDELGEMTVKEITAIAEGAKIKLPSGHINKPSLIAMVAEELAKKGHTELPS